MNYEGNDIGCDPTIEPFIVGIVWLMNLSCCQPDVVFVNEAGSESRTLMRPLLEALQLA